MSRYTVGFMFYSTKVLLVRKNHPAWQSGLLNGPGGAIQEGETATAGMVREFQEETSIATQPENWHQFATEYGLGYTVIYFRSFIDSNKNKLPTVPPHNDAGELLGWVSVPQMQRDNFHGMFRSIGNLRWIIPMAMDWRKMQVDIHPKEDIRAKPYW